jgi:hypothetical protein
MSGFVVTRGGAMARPGTAGVARHGEASPGWAGPVLAWPGMAWRGRQALGGGRASIVRQLLPPPLLRAGGRRLSIAAPFGLVRQIGRLEKLALKLAGNPGHQTGANLAAGEALGDRPQELISRLGT